MGFSYPKKEKLKSKTTIDLLFSKGKTIGNFPLRLVYIALPLENSDVKIKMSVSVSKKYFKKAVDRNYYKRVLREVYRLNKHLLVNELDKPYAMMLFYQTKERFNYQYISEKTIVLFKQFVTKINEKKNPND
jgi:ribonuclease P protein component